MRAVSLGLFVLKLMAIEEPARADGQGACLGGGFQPVDIRRVKAQLAEKGLEIPFVPVDLYSQEHRREAFLAKNPIGLVPVLELDDGTFVSETMTICRYLEELHPEPSVLGRDPLGHRVRQVLAQP